MADTWPAVPVKTPFPLFLNENECLTFGMVLNTDNITVEGLSENKQTNKQKVLKCIRAEVAG